MYLPRHRCCALALMILTGSTTPALALPLIEVFESSSWSGGYTGLLRISNPNDDPPIDGWEIAWTSGPNIDNLWNGVLSTNDGTTTVVNEYSTIIGRRLVVSNDAIGEEWKSSSKGSTSTENTCSRIIGDETVCKTNAT